MRMSRLNGFINATINWTGGITLNWDTLFSMQRNLDIYIRENHELESDNLFEEKFLALLVELGELANETRCFKFWSTKGKSDKAIVLEEYVDNIHFLLSIGLEKGYEFSKIDASTTYLKETEEFNHVYAKCLNFYQDQTREKYLDMFGEYLCLGELLGFSEEDIMQAYHDKNEVNYERQQTGY